MHRYILPLASVLLGGSIATAAIAQQAAPEISVDTLKEVVRTISSDEYEGRAPTTRGEELTINYIRQRFEQAGLQPGNDGSWFQEVPLAENTASPGPLTISGGSAPLTFNYRADFVANTYRLTEHSGVENSEIVFVGYGINAPELGWNDYEGIDVRGKTVIVLVNDPD